MKKILIESIIKFTSNNLEVRVWRGEKNMGFVKAKNIKDYLTAITGLTIELQNELFPVANEILQLEGVNAVEVKVTGSDMGIVLYSDWP